MTRPVPLHDNTFQYIRNGFYTMSPLKRIVPFRLPSMGILVLILTLMPFAAHGAKLDIEGRDLNTQDIRELGGLVTKGVFVTRSTGNALSAGIRDNDVITAVEDREIGGIQDLQQVLYTLKGKKMNVEVRRVSSDGLLAANTFVFSLDIALDMEIRKAFSIDLGGDTHVRKGSFLGQSLLLWHANKAWVFDEEVEREQFVSLLKVYNMAEHKTYIYKVPEKVLWSDFLSEDGLLVYFSISEGLSQLGVLDISKNPRNRGWRFEMHAPKGAFRVVRHDANGDRVPELFVSRDGGIVCLDGKTGNAIWKRADLSAYFNHQRNPADRDYADVAISDFNMDGAPELAAGVILLDLATGESRNMEFLTFDPCRHMGGILQCRDLVGDAMPDIITRSGLLDGGSGEKVWEPLHGDEYFLADVTADGRPEIVYLLGDGKLHIHDINDHRELQSFQVEGTENMIVEDFDRDGFCDILVRKSASACVYQTNLAMPKDAQDRSIGMSGPLLDYGMQKERFFLFARNLYNEGRAKDSIPLLLRAVADNPRQDEAVRYLASAYVKTGNYEGALNLLRGEKKEFARDVLQKFSGEIAAYLLDKGKNAEAIEFLEMRKKEDPILLSRCYLAGGRPEMAISTLLELETKPPEVQMILGRAYVMTNRMAPARSSFQNHLALSPASLEGWLELGELEAHEKNWKEALTAFGKAMELDPVEGHLAMSRFHLKEGPYSDTIKAHEHAMTAHKQKASDSTRLQLAQVRAEERNYDEAEKILNEITSPGKDASRYEELKSRCGYQNAARERLDEAEKLLLSPVFKQKNRQRADDILQLIVSSYPKSEVFTDAHYRLGEMSMEDENPNLDKALYHFTEVVKAKGRLADLAREKTAEIEKSRPSAAQPAAEKGQSADEWVIDLKAKPATPPQEPDIPSAVESGEVESGEKVILEETAPAPPEKAQALPAQSEQKDAPAAAKEKQAATKTANAEKPAPESGKKPVPAKKRVFSRMNPTSPKPSWPGKTRRTPAVQQTPEAEDDAETRVPGVPLPTLQYEAPDVENIAETPVEEKKTSGPAPEKPAQYPAVKTTSDDRANPADKRLPVLDDLSPVQEQNHPSPKGTDGSFNMRPRQ